MLLNSVAPSGLPARCGILMPYRTLANAIILLSGDHCADESRGPIAGCALDAALNGVAKQRTKRAADGNKQKFEHHNLFVSLEKKPCRAARLLDFEATLPRGLAAGDHQGPGRLWGTPSP
jgi:hypothetical protein